MLRLLLLQHLPLAVERKKNWRRSCSLTKRKNATDIQKWIALYPNGHEAWTEWRRTGYPKLNQVQTNRGQGVTREGGIRRMVYPVSFYQSAEDRANYEEALKLLGGLDKDKATTQLWWDCKNKIY